MSTVRVNGISWSIPLYLVDFIELSLDREFFQIYLIDDEPQKPSYEVPSGKTMKITTNDYIVFG